MVSKYNKYLIKEYKNWDLFLHENQYYLGRCYIWSKNNNNIDLLDINKKELLELIEILKKIRFSLLEAFEPDKINYSSLGNITNHLHIHLIPRYKTQRTFLGKNFEDQNWGENYSPYNKNYKIDESLKIKIINEILKRLS